MELNIEQIKELIPHRYPFLLVDRITECVPGERAVGLKCVSANEPFFQGHLELRCALTAHHGSVGFGSAEALVDGEVACKAELTFALADNDKACEN